MHPTPGSPLFATSLGASSAAVGAVASARAVGSLAATLPAGALVARHGERAASLAGIAAYAAACVWGAAAGGCASLAASRALAGASYSLFFLAQQSSVRTGVPAAVRGRVLSSMGGTYRLAGLCAPAVSGALAQRCGFRAVFLLQACSALAALPFLLCSPAKPARPPPPAAAAAGAQPSTDEPPPAPAAAASPPAFAFPPGLALALGATLSMSVLRSVRDLLLPLSAAAAGLSRERTGLLTALSYAGDTLLFPVGGWLMDARGCGAAGALSASVGLLGLLPLALVSPGTPASLAGSALVTGVGNGLSSGIVLTLGSSFAPAHAPGPTLARFNFVASLGGVLGPIAVGAICGASLPAGAAAAVAVAAVTALWWGILLPPAAGPCRAHRRAHHTDPPAAAAANDKAAAARGGGCELLAARGDAGGDEEAGDEAV